MGLKEALKEDPINPKDVGKAAMWITRNLPRAIGWVKYFLGKRTSVVVLVALLAISSTAGSCFRFVGSLPDLPMPPGQETPRPRVESPTEATPTPNPEPRIEPTTTPIPTLAPTETPRPSASPVPTQAPKPQLCALKVYPWLDPAPPSQPVPVKKNGPCPQFTTEVGPDRNGQMGCQITWIKRSGEQGRTPAEGMQVALSNGHTVIDTDGMERDVDNGIRLGKDAYFRPVSNGQLELPSDRPWWDGWAAHPIWCSATIPTPTPGPTPIPPQGCEIVERTFHFMAPGNKCHGGDAGHCVVDSTIRPICDRDHMENWNGICGGRDHDPDYGNPNNAFLWNIEGADDLGPNPSNAAQRIISGASGAHVKVQVCIPPNAQTPDGCLITPTGGGGCGVREFDLP